MSIWGSKKYKVGSVGCRLFGREGGKGVLGSGVVGDGGGVLVYFVVVGISLILNLCVYFGIFYFSIFRIIKIVSSY